MKRTKELREAWARLTAAHSFVLACHQSPDGDALGSALALARVLKRMGKDVVVLAEDGVPENYRFIPESDTILAGTDRRDFDMGVLVDSEGLKRVGSAAEAISSAKSTACIDHHVPNGEFGDVRIVDRTACATAEVVIETFEANDIEIDADCATQLLTGIIADTGAFRFRNTTPRTFRSAAKLTELGAEPSIIAREVYDSRPLRAMKLLGRAMMSLQTDQAGDVVWARIARADFEELGATDADTESIVNHVGAVRGPKVAILFRETAPDSVRVSLRSRDGIDVNRIAREFGGGGHMAAAGCTVKKPLDEAISSVLREVWRWTAS